MIKGAKLDIRDFSAIITRLAPHFIEPASDPTEKVKKKFIQERSSIFTYTTDGDRLSICLHPAMLKQHRKCIKDLSGKAVLSLFAQEIRRFPPSHGGQSKLNDIEHYLEEHCPHALLALFSKDGGDMGAECTGHDLSRYETEIFETVSSEDGP